MSKNISKLSGRIGLKNNLFQKMSDSSLSSKNGEGITEIKEIADKYHVGVSTVHGAESFYEFLRPEHRAKKAFVCNGSACMCAGTQEPLKKKLQKKLGNDKVGEMFCLGYCYENHAFHYDGENYAGNDISKIDQIVKGEKIDQEKFFSKSFASTSFLMDDKLSSIDQFKESLNKFIKTDKKEIINLLLSSNLTGRGGAGFPAGMKWDFCSKTNSEKKYVVCNADEGDSGAFSDRYLLEDQPLKVLFAMIICGYAIGSDEGVLYIRGEYPKSIESINGCINELKDKKLLGKDILGTKFSFDLTICIGQGAYICGEETGLIESLEGKQGKPRFKPPFPATFGLYGQPTTVNNTQTLASVPKILEKGHEWYASMGSEKSPGTVIFSVSGHVNNPGNFELPLAIPFDVLLDKAGGVIEGKKLKAVIPGGSSTKILKADVISKCTMDYESLQDAGSALGTGAVVVIAEGTCMVNLLKRISRFYYAENCGQCSPCREGTGWLYKILHRITQGQSSLNDLSLLVDIAGKIEGTTICAFGDASAWPVQSFIENYYEEFEYMVKNHGKSIAA